MTTKTADVRPRLEGRAVAEIPVRVRAAGLPLDPATRQVVTDRITSRLEVVRESLGIPGTVAVEVDPEPPARPTHPVVEVDGIRCRYPFHLPDRLKRALAQEWSLPATRQELLPGTAPTASLQGPESAIAALEELVVAAVSAHPAALLTDSAAAAHAEALRDAVPALRSSLDLTASLRAVLERGVGVHLAQLVTDAMTAERVESTQSFTEFLITQGASDVVEFLVPADLVETLTGVTPAGPSGSAWPQPDSLIEAVPDHVRETTGVVLPKLKVTWGAREGDVCAVRVNDVVGPPIRLLPSGFCLVNATRPDPEVGGRAALNPVSLVTNVLVAGDPLRASSDGELTSWDRAGLALLFLADELRRRLPDVMSQDRVIAQIEALTGTHPMLVATVRAAHSAADLTSWLRGLLGVGVPLRHLPAILDVALELSDVQDGAWREAFVRRDLAAFALEDRWLEPGHVTAYLLHADLERPFESDVVDREAEDALMNAVAAELDQLPDTVRTPAVITAARAAPAISRLLGQVWPGRLTTFGLESLPTWAVVQPVARIIPVGTDEQESEGAT